MKSATEFAAEQAAFWNGPGGKMWLGAYDRIIGRSLAGFSEVLLKQAAPRPGEAVLDVGCGTGATTAELARAVGPQGRVLGVDIGAELVAAARAQKLANARFEVGDAATWPFDASFDLVFSRFGVMFFGDPVMAFKNLRRALRPAGRLVFLAWRTGPENPWWLVPVRAAQPHLPPMERPGPEDPGPFAFGDRARVERILKESGFGSPAIQPVDLPVPVGNDPAEVAENQGRFGALARMFAEATPDQVAKAKQAVAEALKPYAGKEGVRLPGACWLVTATPG
jgi:SAM-dependent methyltransferase